MVWKWKKESDKFRSIKEHISCNLYHLKPTFVPPPQKEELLEAQLMR